MFDCIEYEPLGNDTCFKAGDAYYWICWHNVGEEPKIVGDVVETYDYSKHMWYKFVYKAF